MGEVPLKRFSSASWVLSRGAPGRLVAEPGGVRMRTYTTARQIVTPEACHSATR